jgi:hypothetical protein
MIKMKSGYIIREIGGCGYWSEYDKRFRGFLYATIYASEEDALLNNSINNDEFEVVRFYKKNNKI